MKKAIKYFAISALGLMLSCTTSDDAQIAQEPEVVYNQNVYQVSFRSGGTSLSPLVEWNGDIGLFSIQKAVPGVSIDFKTGVVSWDNMLPLGENEIIITAVNEAGAVNTSIRLTHTFGGRFEGKMNFPNFEPIFLFLLNFNTNGSGTVSVGDSGNPSDLGFWTLEGNKISGQYSWSDDPGPYFIEGILTVTETNAQIEGRYDEGPVHDESGTFLVNYAPER